MISAKEYNNAVRAYTKNIFHFLMKSLKDEDAAKDILQDCFLKLWQNRKSVEAAKVKSWLFAVAHNDMINYLKVASRKRSMDDYVDEHMVYQKHSFDLKVIIEDALSGLPPVQRSIILLRDLEGYEYKEIGEILKLNESQVKVYLFRARLKVKNSIKSLMNVI